MREVPRFRSQLWSSSNWLAQTRVWDAWRNDKFVDWSTIYTSPRSALPVQSNSNDYVFAFESMSIEILFARRLDGGEGDRISVILPWKNEQIRLTNDAIRSCSMRLVVRIANIEQRWAVA